MRIHPYIQFAVALFGKQNEEISYEDITYEDLIGKLEECKEHICLYCKQTDSASRIAEFGYTSDLPNAKENRFLAPNVISTDSKGIVAEIDNTIGLLRNNKNCKCTVKKCVFPIGGEYTKFSDAGKASKTSASISLKDYSLMLLTATTIKKPCISELEGTSWVNSCILPDMEVKASSYFIDILEKIRKQKCDNLYHAQIDQKGKIHKPSIFNGNFPNTVRSKYLKLLSILGCIGEISKEADYSTCAHNVMEELKIHPLLIVSAGNSGAEVVQVNHHIIDLANDGNLRITIDSLYHSRYYKYKGLYRNDYSHGINKKEVDIEYDKFDYFLSKFLILFNHYSFNEFLSCRMEYPSPIKSILTKYFQSMEKIGIEIIESAEALGAWLNSTAFNVAKKDEAPNEEWSTLPMEKRQKVTEKKYKFLVELESSIFSASNSLSLISHTITRAGRLSESDAPDEARLFIKAAMSSEISLEVAKNLLIAFSRIRSASLVVNNSAESVVAESTHDCSNL